MNAKKERLRRRINRKQDAACFGCDMNIETKKKHIQKRIKIKYCDAAANDLSAGVSKIEKQAKQAQKIAEDISTDEKDIKKNNKNISKLLSVSKVLDSIINAAQKTLVKLGVTLKTFVKK